MDKEFSNEYIKHNFTEFADEVGISVTDEELMAASVGGWQQVFC